MTIGRRDHNNSSKILHDNRTGFRDRPRAVFSGTWKIVDHILMLRNEDWARIRRWTFGSTWTTVALNPNNNTSHCRGIWIIWSDEVHRSRRPNFYGRIFSLNRRSRESMVECPLVGIPSFRRILRRRRCLDRLAWIRHPVRPECTRRRRHSRRAAFSGIDSGSRARRPNPTGERRGIAADHRRLCTCRLVTRFSPFISKGKYWRWEVSFCRVSIRSLNSHRLIGKISKTTPNFIPEKKSGLECKLFST